MSKEETKVEEVTTEKKHKNKFEFTEEERKGNRKRYMQIAWIVIFAACVIIAFYFCISRYEGLSAGWDKFMQVIEPFIIGFALAFLMNPIMKFLEGKMLKAFLPKSKNEKKTRKTIRTICTIISLVVVMGLIILFFVLVLPQLIDTIKYLTNHIEDQYQGVLDWANDLTNHQYEKNFRKWKRNGFSEAFENGLEYIEKYLEIGEDEILSYLTTYVLSVGRFLIDVIIAMVLSVYILMSKETFKAQFKKLLYGCFKAKPANVIMEVCRKTEEIFYGFIIGKIIDSIIIGFICYFFMLITKMPYPVLVSVIVGVTNVIPVFGPYIGAVPTVIIIFLTEPMTGIYFLIFVFILQQVDGNIIGPKILGDTTGISSFWVVVAVVVGGGLFGIPGMFLGVPTLAVIYYLVGRFSNWMVRRRGLTENTKAYTDLDHVDVATGQMVEKTEEQKNKPATQLFQKERKIIPRNKVKEQ